ncbi:MAG: DUF4922 domain-containing protein, partial [Muribaculaceae bacterium]|nr:DUF4922 domain-containing protein [Muribaculaceae bacterium]
MISTNQLHAWTDRQLDVWPIAKANFAALADIQTKIVNVEGLLWKVQFNPARAVSSGAKTDMASINKRPCFLCKTNRPIEQTSLEAGEFEILVNPFPVFPHHYTIAHHQHRRQEINGYWCHLAALAYQLNGYTIFYNGPRCGASAPDHFHFQAVPSRYLPIWEWIEESSTPGIRVPDQLPFGAISVTSDDFSRLSDHASSIMKSLHGNEDEYEPKVNLLCRCSGNLIQLIILPRKAHRPAIYPQKMISPASIDLAGVFITPVHDDFKSIDHSIIATTLDEVCYTVA